MITHPSLSLLCVAENEGSALSSLFTYLETIAHVRLTIAAQWPAALDAHDVVISHGAEANQGRHPDLEGFVHRGGGWLALIDGAESLPALLGVTCGPPGPAAELRVLFEKAEHPLATRLPVAVYLPGRLEVLTPNHEDTESVLYADWHYDHIPVLTQRPVGRGRTAATTLQAYDHPVLQRISTV